MSIFIKNNYKGTIEFFKWFLFFYGAIVVKSTDNEQYMNNADFANTSFTKIGTQNFTQEYTQFKNHPYSSNSIDTQQIAILQEHGKFLEEKTNEGMSNEFVFLLENSPITPLYIQIEEKEKVELEYISNKGCNSMVSMTAIEKLPIAAENENQDITLKTDDSFLDDIIVEALGYENEALLEECSQVFDNYHLNRYEYLMKESSVEKNTEEADVLVSNTENRTFCMDLLDEPPSHSYLYFQNISTVTQIPREAPAQIYNEVNVNKNEDTNIIEDMVTETMNTNMINIYNNEQILSTNICTDDFASCSGTIEDHLMEVNATNTSFTINEAMEILEKIENIITYALNNDPSSSSSRLLETSKVIKKEVQEMNEQDKNDDNDNCMNQEKNQENKEKNNEDIAHLLSEIDGRIIKNTYLSRFEMIVEKLIYIHLLLKDIDPNNVSNIRKGLDMIRNKYKPCIYIMDVSLNMDIGNSFNSPIKSLYHQIQEYDKIPLVSKNDDVVFTIIDSPICMKLFLQLLCNISKENVTRLRKSKNMQTKRRNEIYEFYITEKNELPNNVRDLMKIFSSLSIKTDCRNQLYTFQGYYAAVFLINKVFVKKNEENIWNIISYVISQVIKRENRFMLFYHKLFVQEAIDMVTVINMCDADDDIEENGKFIKSVIGLINEEQEKIKKKLQTYLETSRIASIYIFYHLSYLILHRCFNMNEVDEELIHSFEIYKLFVSLGNSIFSDVFTSIVYCNLSEIEKALLCEDDVLIHTLFTYIILNIIKMSFILAQKDHIEYVKIIKNFYINEKFVFTKRFTETIKFFKLRLSALKYLAIALKAVIEYRSYLLKYMKLFTIEDRISELTNNILELLKSLKTTNTSEEVQIQVKKKFNELYLLYNKYAEIARNKET